MESVVRMCLPYRRVVRPILLTAFAWLLAAFWHSPAQAAIEATRGKTYQLDSRHGPWMIMVTSFPLGESKEQQKNAEEVANELVYQLRKKQVPAYVYSMDDKEDEVGGYDRQGRPRTKKYISQRSMLGVVAGNYDDIEGRVPQLTLKFIKKFQPKVKVKDWDGKEIEQTLVLNKAFLARNPLIPAEEFTAKVKDPLLLKLNSRADYSLFQNKGKYTLVVATFRGNSQVKSTEFGSFEKKQQKGTNISLEAAAEESELLCRTMRAQKNLDAYVWHDRYQSIVTVGSFQSADDPELRQMAEKFQAKWKEAPGSSQPVLVAESFQIPGAKPGAPPQKAWLMNPEPVLMKVPR